MTPLIKLQEQRDDKNIKSFLCAMKDVKRVALKATVFQRFCKIRDIFNKTDPIPSFWKIENINTGNCPTDLVDHAIEERFAHWLKSNEKFVQNEEEYLKNYEDFEKQLQKDASENELIKNPYFLIKSGNKYLENKKYSDAINEYSSAIRLVKNFAEYAYYNRGFARIALFGTSSNYCEQIDNATEDFKKARKLLEAREND
ncbi:MAG: tetratricopeptide repeat protein, partial [Alphaproteobacteria bacterium]|nr:tetratricopeptide repeat protein [Alphaproteobacteria bacterium]